ncbi:MAG TPA: hypothetical protein VH210_06250 [Gaiellaceae bacterium]|nr:hypothetical protein [Gaiellaceae bacterium]
MRWLAVIVASFAAATAARATPSTPFYAHATIGHFQGVVASNGTRYRVAGDLSFAPDRPAVVAAVGATRLRITELGGSSRVVATARQTAPPVYGPTNHIAYAAGTVIRYVGGPTVRATGLPKGARIVQIAMSPDGSTFAATVEWGNGKAGTLRNALYFVSPAGTKRIAGPFDGYSTRPSPVWNPQGDKVAYVAVGDVFVVSSDGSTRTQLSRTPRAIEDRPRWAPDGTQLAYTSGRNGVNEIYVAKLTGGERRLTFTKPAPGTTPRIGTQMGAWSPDGSQIAVVTYNSLAVVPAEGGAPEIVQTFTPSNSVYLGPVAWPVTE